MIAVLAALVLQTQQTQQPVTFERKITRTVTGQYLAYVPEGYETEKNKKWPLILFLHGSGERGDDLNKVKVHGPPKEIEQGRKLPFIVISPQCPDDEYWDVGTLIGLLDDVEKKFRVDKDREYLTGISMGGYGTWALAATEPDRFAAIAPISGGGNPVSAPKLKNVPVWVIHGDKDPSVPIQDDQTMVDWLQRAGGDVRFTIVKDGPHDVWTDIYKGQEIYDWFLAHKRRHRESK